MARYRGPRRKKIRRFQTVLPGLTRKSAEGRPYPPGQHGFSARKSRSSDYRVRLEEKQKLIFNYGVSEKQMRRYFRRAVALKGDTGQNLLVLLESRLDNAVFRAGFAPTIPAARQLVVHGHVRINGRKVDIPSYAVHPGDDIGLKTKTHKNPLVQASVASPCLTAPDYISVDFSSMSAKVTQEPTRDDVPFELQDNLVIEYYSRVA